MALHIQLRRQQPDHVHRSLADIPSQFSQGITVVLRVGQVSGKVAIAGDALSAAAREPVSFAGDANDVSSLEGPAEWGAPGWVVAEFQRIDEHIGREQDCSRRPDHRGPPAHCKRAQPGRTSAEPIAGEKQ
jgi:hypothetical protein